MRGFVKVTHRLSNAREKIPWEGEFSHRSDP